jgi:hypothetical protein
MDRPDDINTFQKLMYYSIGLGLISSLLFTSDIYGSFNAIFVLLLIAIFGVMYWLIRQIVIKASITAKWILTVLFAIGALITIGQLPDDLGHGMKGFVSLIQLILQSIAIYKLFTTPSVKWFDECNSASANQLVNISSKKCPFCAEEIKVDAIKCRFCGSDLTKK